MSDSSPNLPPASEPGRPQRKRPARRREVDDESIDLDSYDPVEEGSAVLSFSGRHAAPVSGSSIIPWEELARSHGPQEGTPGRDAAGDVDFDAASDMDLLRQILSNEPPPSQII